MRAKAAGLLAGSFRGLVFGGLWGIWFPINKRLWTSSYVLYAAGWSLLILFLCYVVIDIKKHQGAWTYPWKVFGSNAIFAYAFAELLSIVLGSHSHWKQRQHGEFEGTDLYKDLRSDSSIHRSAHCSIR